MFLKLMLLSFLSKIFYKNKFIFGEYSYILFEIINDKRFTVFKNLFDLLKEAKNENNFKTEEYWLSLSDEGASSYLVKNKNWNYESIIEIIKNSEYILRSCELNNDNIGIIEFEALSYPYGGTYTFKILKEINT